MGNYNYAFVIMLFLAFASIAHFNVVKAQNHICYHHIWVKTGNQVNAGTKARVTLQLYDQGRRMIESTNLQEDRVFLLPLGRRVNNTFERNREDYFRIYNDDCRQSWYSICEIKLSHDNTGEGSPDWYVEYVRVLTSPLLEVIPTPNTHENDGKMFAINQWLAKDKKPYSLSAHKDLCGPHRDPIKDNSCTYFLSVKTGNKEGAGTNARVTLKLYDAQGNMTELTDLASYGKNQVEFTLQGYVNHDHFERNVKDNYQLYYPECRTSQICKIELSHDDSGKNPGWYVDYVTTDTTYENKVRLLVWEYTKYEINQWLARDEEPKSLVVVKDKCGPF